jgi:phosphoribosylanthranilate isomerase
MTAPTGNRPHPLVKICGISVPDHAHVAVDAGADFIGVVFYPRSIRYVSVAQARAVSDAAHAASGGRVKVVGLFVNADAATINDTIEAGGLDLVQLSGDEGPRLMSQIQRPAIGTIRIDSSGRLDEETVFRTWTSADPPPFALLVDSHVAGMYGGTGTVSDWFVAADFARRFPVLLAGGLAPENVAPAIRIVQPFAVDVSSGVETEGRKDPEKIRAFIRAAKSALHQPAAALSSPGGNR